MFRCIALGLLAFILPVLAGSDEAQLQLSALTVPQDRLPKGCRLALETEMPGLYKENPWAGNGGPRLASIRSLVEGGPPPATGELLRRDETVTRSAEHVLEAYSARYRAENDDAWVQVSAVRFDDPKWTAAAALIRLEGEMPRIILGPVAVRVTRSTPMTWAKPQHLVEACYEAVRKYISTLSLPRGDEDKAHELGARRVAFYNPNSSTDSYAL